jgi:neutral ceramidase
MPSTRKAYDTRRSRGRLDAALALLALTSGACITSAAFDAHFGLPAPIRAESTGSDLVAPALALPPASPLVSGSGTVEPDAAGPRDAAVSQSQSQSQSQSRPGVAPDDRAPRESGLSAGAAAIDITPPPGLPMWGYGGRKDLPAQGVLDPLYASAVVIETGSPGSESGKPDADGSVSVGSSRRRIAIVGLDLGRGPARHSFDRIRERIRREAAIDQVWLVGSHTHHGPCIELERTPAAVEYVRELDDRICRVIADAARALRPAKLGAAWRDVDRNRNRHSKLTTKPRDPRLSVIHLTTLLDETIAILVNFGAHPTNIPATKLEYSADFPGHLRRYVEAARGGRCVFLQGAVGDQSAKKDGLDVRGYGEALGADVISLLDETRPVVLANPTLETREEEFRFGMRIRLDDPKTYFLYSVAFFQELVDAFVKEYEGGVVRPRLTAAVLDGRIGFVGCSGEFFSAHAVRLRERARLDHLFFFSCCNGYHQYFPTIEATAEGGYGADPEVSPVEIGAGERIMDRALMLLYEMRRGRDG